MEALLDSWDRNNPQLFMHIHYVRLVFVVEDAPEFANPLPAGE
jgi:hypothetical protein